MMMKHLGLIAVSALALAACDVVRVPGDGREAPVIPDGAPGPAPPMVPVNDPWDEDNDGLVTDDPSPDTGPDIDPGPDPDVIDEPGSSDPDNDDDPVVDETPEDDGSDVSDPDDTEPDPPITDSSDLDPTDPDETDPAIPDPDETDPETTDPDAADPEPPVDEAPPVAAPLPVKFEYFAPGDLIPGTGQGRVDEAVYAPDILFPIKAAPTWPQSMVYRLGGAVGGDQCDPENYDIPWRDNFCEQRSSTRNTPLCPTNKVHQGQDIRVGSADDCNALRRQDKRDRGLHEVIAVEDGVIQHIGTYSVQLKGTETGNLYSYLHLNMRRLRVSALDIVEAGDTLGFVSNDFGTTPTTFHLHFEIKAPIEGEGIVHVPPYMSLVAAYERREGGIGKRVEEELVGIASAPVIVDPSKLIE
jgi:hypothetical protein